MTVYPNSMNIVSPYNEVADELNLDEAAQMFKAIGDVTRIRMLGLLRHGELCVCDLMAVLELPQSTASRHLAYLKNSHWISGTRRGKWMYYQLREEVFHNSAFQGIIDSLTSLRRIDEDYTKLLHHLESKGDQQCD